MYPDEQFQKYTLRRMSDGDTGALEGGGYAKSEIDELSDWPNGILQRGSEVCIGGNNGKTQNTVISSTGTAKWLKDKRINETR